MLTMGTEDWCFVLVQFGTAILLYKGAKLVYRLFSLFITYSKFRGTVPFREYGSWAVITGATSGIGRQYAEQLAAKGLNIVLVSRSQSNLANLAAEIAAQYKVKTEVIVADFTQGLELYQDIGRRLSAIDVGILVNNVGMLSPAGDFLQIQDWEKIYPAVLNCNSLAMAAMTSLVLPNMAAKGKGIVVNVSSLAGEGHHLIPAAIYASTKSFVSSLARSLHTEYALFGIVVQNLTAGPVATNFGWSNRKPTSVEIRTPAATFVQSALHTITTSSDTSGYFWHQFTLDVLNCLPDPVMTFLAARSRSYLKVTNKQRL